MSRLAASISVGFGGKNDDAGSAVEYDARRRIAVVADGVGSAKLGGLAAKYCVDKVICLTKENYEISMEALFHKVQEGLRALHGESSHLACTLTVVRLNSLSFDVGHVGDSRAYHLRGHGIVDITTDQNQGQLLIEQGAFDRRNIRKYPARNVLYSYMSPTSHYALQTRAGKGRVGDRLLAVSDGLYDSIKRGEIAALNSSSENAEQLVHKIRYRLEARPPQDDATAVCVELGAH